MSLFSSFAAYKRASHPQARAAKKAATALRRCQEQLNHMQATPADAASTATFREIGVYFTPRGYYSHVCFIPNEKNAHVRWPVVIRHLQEHDFCFVRVAQQFVDGQPVSGTERYFSTDIRQAYSVKDTGFPWDLHVGPTPYVTIKCSGEKGSLTRVQLEYHLDEAFVREGHAFVPNLYMQMPYAAPVREFLQKVINQTSAEFGSQVIQVVPIYETRDKQPIEITDPASALGVLDHAKTTTWLASEQISSGNQRMNRQDSALLADNRVVLTAERTDSQWVRVVNVKSTPSKKRSHTVSELDAPTLAASHVVAVKRHRATPREMIVYTMPNNEMQHGDDDMDSVQDDQDELDSQATRKDEAVPSLPTAKTTRFQHQSQIASPRIESPVQESWHVSEQMSHHLMHSPSSVDESFHYGVCAFHDEIDADDFFKPAPLVGLIDPVAAFNCEDLL